MTKMMIKAKNEQKTDFRKILASKFYVIQYKLTVKSSSPLRFSLSSQIIKTKIFCSPKITVNSLEMRFFAYFTFNKSSLVALSFIKCVKTVNYLYA